MTRRDSYADSINYKDKGCEEHPACLSCPLPMCKYEYSAENITEMRARRDIAIQQDFNAGMTQAAISRKYKLSDNAVRRAVRRDPELIDEPGKPWDPNAVPVGYKPRKELPSLKP